MILDSPSARWRLGISTGHPHGRILSWSLLDPSGGKEEGSRTPRSFSGASGQRSTSSQRERGIGKSEGDVIVVVVETDALLLTLTSSRTTIVIQAVT